MSINIAFVGDTHGRLKKQYAMIEEWERLNDANIDAIVNLGDTGIWFDDGASAKMGKTHRHFSDILHYINVGSVPKLTYFIRGNHEDFTYLWDLVRNKNTPQIEIVSGLNWLRNGYIFDLFGIRFGCLGGNYGSGNYKGSELNAKQAKRRHFYEDELNKLIGQDIDILLTHDAPEGIFYGKKFLFPDVGAKPLNNLIETITPKYWFHGHYHHRQIAYLNKTKIISLDKCDRGEEGFFNWDSLFVLKYNGKDLLEII